MTAPAATLFDLPDFSNCPRYALAWRNQLLASLSDWQQEAAVPLLDLAA